MKNSALRSKRIGDIMECDKNLPMRDYKGEIKELKQKIVQLEEEITKMKSGGNITKVVDNSAPIIDIKKFKNVVGIDFWSTEVSIYLYEPDRKKYGIKYCVVNSRFGERITPTDVHFACDGELIVGMSTKNRRYYDPKNTVYYIKRLIGKKKGDKSNDVFFGKALFKIVYHGNHPFIHKERNVYI